MSKTAIIFNFINFENNFEPRKSSVHDVRNLKILLYSMNFKLVVHNDLTLEQLLAKIDKYSTYDFKDTTCMLIFFMSHGGNNNIVYSTNGTFNFEKESTKILSNPSLRGKPAYIIVQACKGVFNTDFNYDSDDSKNLRPNAMFLSSFEGFVSHLNIDGSPFIRILTDRFKKEWINYSVLNIFYGIRSQMEAYIDCQAPTIVIQKSKDTFCLGKCETD